MPTLPVVERINNRHSASPFAPLPTLGFKCALVLLRYTTFLFPELMRGYESLYITG